MEITLTKTQLKQVEKHIQKELWNAVSVQDILIPKGDVLTKDGKILTTEQICSLKDGAVTILALDTWKQLTADMRHVANRKMFENSESWEDMTYGKALLYAINLM